MFNSLVLLVFDSLHAFGRTASAEPGIDERIEVAVHDALDVTGFNASAKVFDHPVRLEHVAANLVAPRDAAFLSIETFHLRLLRVDALGIDAGEQKLHRRRSILMLRPLALRCDDESGWNMRNADGGLDFVNV